MGGAITMPELVVVDRQRRMVADARFEVDVVLACQRRDTRRGEGVVEPTKNLRRGPRDR
jgi:hypothetical protein